MVHGFINNKNTINVGGGYEASQHPIIIHMFCTYFCMVAIYNNNLD